MERNANFIIVGIFALIGTVSLAYFAYWLGKYGPNERPFYYYETALRESVTGLKASSPVKLKGIDVGFVEDIRLDTNDPELVRVAFKVYQGTPIKSDSMVSLNSQGIAGTAYLDIQGGSKEAPLLLGSLESRSYIPSKLSMIAMLSEKASKAVDTIDHSFERFGKIASDSNIKNLSTVLANSAKITESIYEQKHEFSTLINDAKSIESTALQTLVSIDQTNLKAQEMLHETKVLASNGNALLEDVNKSQIPAKLSLVLDNANETVFETKLTLQEAKTFIQELRESPSNLLFKSKR